MLLARFGSNFCFEGARLSAQVGPGSVVGYCRGPALAAVSFLEGIRLDSLSRGPLR